MAWDDEIDQRFMRLYGDAILIGRLGSILKGFERPFRRIVVNIVLAKQGGHEHVAHIATCITGGDDAKAKDYHLRTRAH